jgi:putative NIF3 family GTP cyclohydrolase 1 type 2
MKYLAILTLAIIALPTCGQTSRPKASDITEKIIKKTGAPEIPGTVDVFKTGNPEEAVTGIITTMFATMDVLKKAVEMKCNLIIVHEPLFYNHTDNTGQFGNSAIYKEKKKYIDDNGLIIWRFHDYIHSIKPDAINKGMTIALGWEKYVTDKNESRYTVPEITLEELLAHLKKCFHGNTFNYVGNPGMKLKNIALAAGAPGSERHMRLLDDAGVDLVIAGESPQWESYEYARDAVDQGRKKGIVFLGHIPSEEAGMKYCAEWLRSFITDIPVSFVSSGPSYRTY